MYASLLYILEVLRLSNACGKGSIGIPYANFCMHASWFPKYPYMVWFEKTTRREPFQVEEIEYATTMQNREYKVLHLMPELTPFFTKNFRIQIITVLSEF